MPTESNLSPIRVYLIFFTWSICKEQQEPWENFRSRCCHQLVWMLVTSPPFAKNSVVKYYSDKPQPIPPFLQNSYHLAEKVVSADLTFVFCVARKPMDNCRWYCCFMGGGNRPVPSQLAKLIMLLPNLPGRVMEVFPAICYQIFF